MKGWQKYTLAGTYAYAAVHIGLAAWNVAFFVGPTQNTAAGWIHGNGILGAYLYETFDGEHARPRIGVHLREGFPPIGDARQVAERLGPGGDGTVYVELVRTPGSGKPR